MSGPLVTLRVWGDFACFTRPEMKVERVSYPVPTPSAARGMLEAVFWEPQMRYLVDAIRIVRRGRWISIRRNEVAQVSHLDPAQRPIRAGGGAPDGVQRNMLALAEVEYLITAEVTLAALASPGQDTVQKYLAEIERRARHGKCFHRPALGMREFAADFEWEDDADAALDRRCREIGQDAAAFNEDIGLMLYDVFQPADRGEGFRWLSPGEPRRSTAGSRARRRQAGLRFAGRLARPSASFFHARVSRSRLECHPSRVRLLSSQVEPA